MSSQVEERWFAGCQEWLKGAPWRSSRQWLTRLGFIAALVGKSCTAFAQPTQTPAPSSGFPGEPDAVLTDSARSLEAARAVSGCSNSSDEDPIDEGLADKILLVSVGHELACALVAALAPWGLQLVYLESDQLGSSMPSTSLAAKRIAAHHETRAVVWLARDADGYALWVYDRKEDRTVARPVSRPPFAPSVAAALALTVKTTIRMVGLASEPEPPPVVAAPSRAPVEDSSSPTQTDSATWDLAMQSALRWGPFRLDAPTLRYGVDLRLSPMGRLADSAFWLSLGLESGEPLNVSTPIFSGEVSDSAGNVGLGVAFLLGRGWTLGLREELSVHAVRLSGTALEAGTRLSDTRANAVLVSGAGLAFAMGKIWLGLDLSGGYWLGRQHYSLRPQGESVLRMRAVSAQVAAFLRVPLD